MNKVYESDTMVVHDDREPLTPEQAFDILWKVELFVFVIHLIFQQKRKVAFMMLIIQFS